MLLLLAVVMSLITPFYIIYKPPSLLIRYFQYRWRDVLWHVTTKSKFIALTIDDGPSQHTEEILQILKANHASATFFVIGSQVDGREKVLQDMIRGRNELANHAMYDEPSKSLTDEELTKQVQLVQGKLHLAYESVGVKAPPQYFRPGSGFFSERMRKTMKELGYKIVLGSIYPHDPQIPYWRLNAAHILSMARPGGIIICHDRRSWTAPMLEKVLPELRKRGYRIVTVTELLEETKE